MFDLVSFHCLGWKYFKLQILIPLTNITHVGLAFTSYLIFELGAFTDRKDRLGMC